MLGGDDTKKFVALLLACVLASGVYAEELIEVYEPLGQTTQVTHHVDSQFIINIPATVHCDGVRHYFSASLMDLCPGDTIDISIWGLSDNEGHFALSTADNARHMTAQVFSTASDMPFADGGVVATFTDGATATETGFYILSATEDAKPGDYYGSIQFNIDLRRGI